MIPAKFYKIWCWLQKGYTTFKAPLKCWEPQQFDGKISLKGIVEFLFKTANAFKVHGYWSYSYLWQDLQLLL